MRRDEGEKIELALDDNLVDNVNDLLDKYYENLKTSAWDFQNEHVKFTDNIEEIASLVESGNVVAFNWCGDDECGKEIEEKTGYDILGIHKDAEDGAKCIASGKDAKYLALIAKTY